MGVYMQNGSEGDLVIALQEALNELGYELEVDGIFGEDTDSAVREFQEENELEVDGIVGADTLDALGLEEDSEGGKGRDSDVVYLEKGSSGSAVRSLQRALVNAGYEIDVDGVFGSGTLVAVRRFQSSNQLDVDGVVGPNTWAALEQFTG